MTTAPCAGARAASAAAVPDALPAAAEPTQEQQQQHQEHQAAPAPPSPPPQQYQPQAAPAQYSPPPQPPGVRRTFYRRVLPTPPATAFSSPEGRRLFAEALADGTMAGFFPLVEQYSTQDEPAFCGLSSLAMVLNALAIDPRRPWKGAWRWFHERLLDCCLPLSDVAARGVTLDQAACIARCNGAVVKQRRSGDFSLDEFRAAVADACATGERHLVVSYARAAFGQTGDGHFSPVGGYHARADLALILDTARFKYPPHWVPVALLYEAMKPADAATGLPRGWLRLSAPAHPQDSVLFTLDVREHGRWRAAERFVLEGAAAAARGAAAAATAGGAARTAAVLRVPRAEDVVRAVVAAVAASPASRGSVGDFVAVRLAARERAVDRPGAPRQQQHAGGEGGDGERQQQKHACGVGGGAGAPPSSEAESAPSEAEACVPLGKRDQLLAELRHMPLFALVVEALASAAAPTPAAALSVVSPPPALPFAGGYGADPPTAAAAGPHAAAAAAAPLREAAQVAAPGGVDGLLAEKLSVLLFLVDRERWPSGAEWGDGGGGAGGGADGASAASAAAADEAARFASLLDAGSVSLVEAEVRYMREQLRHLDALLGGGSDPDAAGCGTDGAAAAAAAAAAAGAGGGSGGSGGALAPTSADGRGGEGKPPPRLSSDASDCSKCFTPLDCLVKGHRKP